MEAMGIMREKRTYIFGPVLSRRLGYSLGVDIFHFKVCNLNCIYCELGRTTKQIMSRLEYISKEAIFAELEDVIRKAKHPFDYITLTGSGEPTLNSQIGELIRCIKSFTAIPIAVLTNSTLLYLPEVRHDLIEADLVLPSLDAASQRVFRKSIEQMADCKLKKLSRDKSLFAINVNLKVKEIIQ